MKKKTGLIVLTLMLAVSATACGSKKGTKNAFADKMSVAEGRTEQEEEPVGRNPFVRFREDDTEEPEYPWKDSKEPKTEEPATEEPPTEAPVDRFPGRSNADTGEGTPKILQVGDVAPDFTIDLKDGRTFRLSDFDDEVILINFWATWCGPCVGEMPAFEQLQQEGYNILCINCGDNSFTTNQFADQNEYSFMVGCDEDYRIITYYPTDYIPYTVVVDHGVIAKLYTGANDYSEYKSALDSCY